jgi:NADH-quinone oxidoreductase subunit C
MPPSVDTAIQSLQTGFSGRLIQIKEFRGESTIEIAPVDLVSIARHLKEELGFDYLVDITGVDHLDQEPRFEVVYEFSNYVTAVHLRLKVRIETDNASVPTLCPVYQGANWHEREVYDMFGITFPGHPDLRRIIMWEGYPYHPLRKDFPLEGLSSDVPNEAFTEPAPLAGGPFVSSPASLVQDREPRAKPAQI